MPASKTLTRGPLPPETYWRRRVIVLIGAAVLVFLIAQLLGAGSDGKGGAPLAQQAGAQITTNLPTNLPTMTGSQTAVSGPTYTPTGGASTSTPPLTLVAPTGPCSARDITVTPSVTQAVAGADITVTLALQTKTEAACTWQVDQRDIAVKIARHSKILWTSQQCPSALPNRSVVVRSVVPSIVTMVWNGRVSTVNCLRGSSFVYPGRLNIYATTLGGQPKHSPFTLVLPTAHTVTTTPTAPTSATATSTAKATSTATAKTTGQPRR